MSVELMCTDVQQAAQQLFMEEVFERLPSCSLVERSSNVFYIYPPKPRIFADFAMASEVATLVFGSEAAIIMSRLRRDDPQERCFSYADPSFVDELLGFILMEIGDDRN